MKNLRLFELNVFKFKCENDNWQYLTGEKRNARLYTNKLILNLRDKIGNTVDCAGFERIGKKFIVGSAEIGKYGRRNGEV